MPYMDVMGLAKITNFKQLTSNIHCMSSFVSSLIVTIDSSVLGVNCQVPQAASKLLLCATKGDS